MVEGTVASFRLGHLVIRAIRTLLVGSFLVAGTMNSAWGEPIDPPADVKFTDRGAQGAAKVSRDLTGAAGTLKGADAGGAPAVPSGTPISAHIAKTDVKGPQRKDKVEVKYVTCENSMPQCEGTRAGCITESGNPNNYDLPVITLVSVNDGPWQANSHASCGPPQSVTIPGAPGQPAQVVPVQAPPVPTFAQIQTAFRELPFSKPSVTVQPKDMRTLKNFTTFYAASWPNNSGLQPGETSKPIKLLSWTVEFKVAAQDYRYNFGDNKTSGWTSSPGGTYPDGDVTHKYATTGDMNVKIDARLTGQYRVNGGDWQDIATVADLQDEPVDTLEVVGTRTRLTSNEG